MPIFHLSNLPWLVHFFRQSCRNLSSSPTIFNFRSVMRLVQNRVTPASGRLVIVIQQISGCLVKSSVRIIFQPFPFLRKRAPFSGGRNLRFLLLAIFDLNRLFRLYDHHRLLFFRRLHHLDERRNRQLKLQKAVSCRNFMSVMTHRRRTGTGRSSHFSHNLPDDSHF